MKQKEESKANAAESIKGVDAPEPLLLPNKQLWNTFRPYGALNREFAYNAAVLTSTVTSLQKSVVLCLRIPFPFSFSCCINPLYPFTKKQCVAPTRKDLSV